MKPSVSGMSDGQLLQGNALTHFETTYATFAWQEKSVASWEALRNEKVDVQDEPMEGQQ